MEIYLSYLLIPVLIWAINKIVRASLTRTLKLYPPGPKPKPIIGNMLDIPKFNAPREYIQWEKKYNSKILHAEALGTHIIVLNDVEDVDELLERRAKNYSDRAHIPLLKHMGWDFNISLMRHDDQWRLHRKICQQNFRADAQNDFLPIEVQKVHDMLQDMLDAPQNVAAHIKKMSIAIALSSMYGYDLETVNDPCVIAAEKSAVEGSKLLLPGASYVNTFPILGKIPAWVPGARSVKIATEVKRQTEEMKRIPTEYITRKMKEGLASPSLMTNMLEKKFSSGVSKEEETAVENIAYTVYGAGTGTTTASVQTFFYLMAKHPEIQRKAQAEIDRVIGSKRLPTYDDRLSGELPYIEAIYREVMRLAAPLPFALPHCSSEDDVYKGYFIPKGSMVFPNVWAMTHDETRYPDPYEFKPERFIDENGKLNNDGRVLAYGFGRRACVGKYVASSTVWLSIVSALACFNIGNPKDENGNEMELNHDYEEYALVRFKVNLNCALEVRSPDIAQLIKYHNQ